MRIKTRFALSVVMTASLAVASFWAAASASAQGGAEPAAGANYESPMRDRCEAELRLDADWRSDLKGQLASTLLSGEASEEDAKQWREGLKKRLEREVHERDANQMLRNKRHVVMAYAVLWVLVLGFVVFMWTRQRELRAEITRLRQEVEQATSEAA